MNFHQKNNLTRYAADLNMLCIIPELQSTFINTETKKPKEVGCIRVDGLVMKVQAMLVKVQFHLIKHHILQ